MAILHSTAADAGFSAAGASAWDAAHLIQASTLATEHLGGDITAVGADLLTRESTELVRVYLGVNVSSAAFTASTDYAVSSHEHSQYQAVSTLSSAAFQVSSFFAISTAISTAAFRDSSFFAVLATLSSAAYTLSTVYAASTHASRHQAGGADALDITSLPGFPGGTANFLRADASFAAPAGGADPWTYLSVSGAHFAVSNVAMRPITGLNFTPAANSTYEFEGVFALRTGSTSINPMIGIGWPTGISTAVGWINQAQSGTGQIMAFGNQASTVIRTVGGSLPNSTHPWPAILGGFMQMGGAPGSSFRILLASETSSTIFVSSCIGSFVKYRTI